MRLFLTSLTFLAVLFFAQVPVSFADDATCATGSSCVTDSGQAGTCDASNSCIANNTQVTPNNPGGGTQLLNPLKGGASLESFLQSILAFVIRIGTIVVVLMVVYVGYLFVVAQGNDSKLTEARKALLWTIIGALILLGAQAIAAGITATVNALSVGQ